MIFFITYLIKDTLVNLTLRIKNNKLIHHKMCIAVSVV